MCELVHGLKEIAAINLRYALAEVMVAQGDRFAVARARDHLREAEASLQILLMKMGDYSTEPTIAMAAEQAAGESRARERASPLRFTP